MWSDKELQEGRDYQFLYYGGRLLSHYTAEVEANELIGVLLTNRNAVIVIDSDKRHAQSPLNDTKKRIRSEFQNANLFCWVTKGKEIENYIPYQAIEQMLNKKINKQCSQYELFPKYIASLCPGFTNEKVGFANKICEFITSENSKSILDLKDQVKKLFNIINGWNPEY